MLTGTAAATAAGPAIVISFIVSGLAAALAALCYSEMASMIPVAGIACVLRGTVGVGACHIVDIIMYDNSATFRILVQAPLTRTLTRRWASLWLGSLVLI